MHSPSTRKLDLDSKQAIYAREDVGCLWLLDPEALTLEAFRLHRTEWVLIDRLSNHAPVSLPPFDAISFNLGDLWTSYTVHKEPPRKLTIESEPELTVTSK